MTDDPKAVFAGPFRVSEESLALYAQAGACLLEWADIERALLYICSSALKSDDETARVVYGRTPTIESRLALIADLLAVRFPKKSGEHEHDILSRFSKLAKETRTLSAVRNDIAHGKMQQIAIAYVRKTETLFEAVEPPVGAPTSLFEVHASETRSGKSKRIDLTAMRAHQKSVLNLGFSLRALYQDLSQALASGSPATDLPHTSDT